MSDAEYVGDPIQDLVDFKTKLEDLGAGPVAHIPPLSLEDQIAIMQRVNLESGGYSYGGPAGVSDCGGSLAGASQGLMQMMPSDFESFKIGWNMPLPEKRSASEIAEMGENDG